jgi:S1-C subfamily serine protease
VEVSYLRDGKEKTATVTLKNKEGNTTYLKKEEVSNNIEALGAEFANISSKEKKDLGLEGGVKVMKLGDGKLSRSTNMREGFIITKIDNRPVNNLDDLKSALANKKGGVMIEGRYRLPGQYFYAFGM